VAVGDSDTMAWGRALIFTVPLAAEAGAHVTAAMVNVPDDTRAATRRVRGVSLVSHVGNMCNI